MPQNSIPSPYNFVPTSDVVVCPPWANLVSQDIPFKDGLCGVITIEIEAKTPVYIRNGGDHPQKPEEKAADTEYQDFFAIETGGPAPVYAIPGTSLKGVIRSVLEIVSFSRMSRMADKHMAYRDLHNKDLYLDKFVRNGMPLTKGGFLRLNDKDRWLLAPCTYSRISHEALKTQYDWAIPMNKDNTSPSVAEKYKSWKTNCPLEIRFRKMGEGDQDNILATDIGQGPDTGMLVFTGQPNRSKSKDFIFHDKKADSMDVTHLKKQFIDSHTVEGEASESWEFWKSKFEQGAEIPVFYLPDHQGAPTSIGLAQLYRLPFRKSLKEALPESHRKEKGSGPDFTETLLGYVDSGSGNALKGRVAFHPAKSIQIPSQTRNLQKVVLGSPKPSYYPNYVEQEGGRKNRYVTEKYKTLDDENARLRGWKRYPVHPLPVDEHIPSTKGPNGSINEDIQTHLRPLPAGSLFSGSIVFHNLLPVELGAVLWCLEWGGNASLLHSVGMAKPFGYGAVKITAEISRLKANFSGTEDPPKTKEGYREIFEGFMERELKQGWKLSPQMRELMAMANPHKTAAVECLRYPVIDPTKSKDNEFSNLKKEKKFLQRYTHLVDENPANHVSLQEKLKAIENDRDSRAPFRKGDPIESIRIESNENKRKNKTWWIHFQCSSKEFKGRLTEQAMNVLPAEFGKGPQYRFTIKSFSETNPEESILLDFADNPPIAID